MQSFVSYDMLLTVVIVATLPVCFLRPWVGMLVFAWIGFMNPHRLLDGFAYQMPYAKMVAGVTLAGLLVTRERYALPRTREVYLLAALWVTFVCSTVFVALQPEVAWEKLAEISKILLMTGATIVLFQDRRKLNVLLVVIAFSIGYFAVTGGLWSLYTGFQERLYGPAKSAIADNNDLGFALTMVLPIFVLLRRQVANPWIRHALLAMFGLSIVAVFATYSRGALIGLCIVLPLTLVLTRTKDVPVLLAAVAACLVIYITPRQWVERMQTITPTVYRDDSSGSKRITSWYVAFRLGLDHPLLGAGFRPFEPDVYERYLPGYWDNHDAHNHFLQVFAEHGFTGLLLFTGLLVSLFLTLLRIRRATRGDPARQWIGESAQFIGASLVAYVVGGVFLNMPYFDLFYQLVAVVVILQQAAQAPGNVIAEPEEPLLRAVWARMRWRTATVDLPPSRVGG
jgi:putative inorganic carbon (hco3(-)) transporter